MMDLDKIRDTLTKKRATIDCAERNIENIVDTRKLLEETDRQLEALGEAVIKKNTERQNRTERIGVNERDLRRILKELRIK